MEHAVSFDPAIQQAAQILILSLTIVTILTFFWELHGLVTPIATERQICVGIIISYLPARLLLF